MQRGIIRAIEAAGSQKKLAESLGVTQQFISFAKMRGWVSPRRAAQIEEVTGIDRWELLRPSITDTLKNS
jgi:DNA-binding transcriptional regulator YdaS (Cro superfamily)